MTRPCIAYPMVLTGILLAGTAFGQTTGKTADRYDPAAEVTVKGTISGVLAPQGPNGVVGVHIDLKTEKGLVKAQVGPALFIGESNFWFQCDDEVEMTGAMVSHGGSSSLWVRQITKSDRTTLKLREDSGAPVWKVEGQTDPDGCGVAHPPAR